jgi:anti-sigma factor RsiW
MTEQTPDFQTLNAYVDGEVAPDMKASIDRYVARNSKLAREVEALRRMKSGVAGIGSDVVVLQLPTRRPQVSWAALGAVAAMLMLTFVGGWFVATTFNRSAGREGANTIVQALKLHDDWSATVINTSVHAADLRSFNAPELAAAGLTLVALKADAEIAGKQAIQAGYLGEHGCKLSLFQIPGAEHDLVFHIVNEGGVQSAEWADGSFRYVVIARKLAVTRFALLADALRGMTTHLGRPPSQDIMAQLESAHQPCRG